MGTLYVIATPIGNLSDISKRALDILNSVDLIAAEDTRWTIKLLNNYQIRTKMISYHKFNEEKRVSNLIEKLVSGLNIALVSDAGTPCISDPGYIIVKEARVNNIPVIGIPGASALTTSLSISGLDTSEFTFYGFLPSDKSKMKKKLAVIKKSDVLTNVFYESPKRLVSTVELLKESFPNSDISICSDLTKIHERNFYGLIENVYQTISDDSNIEKGEYVIVLRRKGMTLREEKICDEAFLIDEVMRSNCSIKEAINNIITNNKEFRKNDLYQASLNLKRIMKDKEE